MKPLQCLEAVTFRFEDTPSVPLGPIWSELHGSEFRVWLALWVTRKRVFVRKLCLLRLWCSGPSNALTWGSGQYRPQGPTWSGCWAAFHTISCHSLPQSCWFNAVFLPVVLWLPHPWWAPQRILCLLHVACPSGYWCNSLPRELMSLLRCHFIKKASLAT